MQIGSIDLGERPIVLAPMEDISDPPFRHICKRYGADLVYTEFISSDGLIREGAKSVKKRDCTPHHFVLQLGVNCPGLACRRRPGLAENVVPVGT